MTPAEQAQLKSYIEANPVWMAYPHTDNGSNSIALELNQMTTDFYVWNNQMPVQTIFDGVTWANLTPTDAADGTQLWMNRSLACQGKQFNLQTILTGRETLDASKTSVRAGIQDALTNVPSGVGGAIVTAGWVGVRDSMKKLATGLEKALATGTGTFASPAVTGNQTQTSWSEIQFVMGWY